jgi:hypothetical protein
MDEGEPNCFTESSSLLSRWDRQSTLSAQLDRATLTGAVTDKTGAVVPNAAVTISSDETGLRRSTQTTRKPADMFSPSCRSASTRCTVAHPGMRHSHDQGRALGVGDNRTLNAQARSERHGHHVTVEGTTAALETESPVIGAVIGSRQVREMPLNGRHWASLMALAPGAINTGDGSQQTIRFVGRSRDDNNWTFDGLDATGVKDPRQEAALRLVISTDTIAEFRVNTTLYSAESGSGAGGQINLVSKSGTNQYHGSVFEFFRNDKMDARNPFDTSKQPFRLNQFGGSIGGPIVKNKTFFFANYEGLRQRVTQTFTDNVPSAAYKSRSTIPSVNLVLAAYPIGTLRSSDPDIDQVQANRSQQWTENSASIRVDHRFNERNSIFGRYNIDDGATATPRSSIDIDRQNDNFRPSNLVMQYQRIFSPSVVNEVKAGFNRSTLHRVGAGPLPRTVTAAGFMTLNQQTGLIEAGTSYSLIDNLVITRGRHNLKFGFEVRRAHVNVADPAVDSSTVNFTSRPNLLANRVDSVALTAAANVLGTRKTYWYGYVQDDFKVLPNLTLNLGLRYEYYGINKEVHDIYKVFDMYACKGFCPQGTPWYFPDRNNFDPRVGLAWSLGKTVIRAGGGLYHGPGQIDDVNTALDNVSARYSLTTLEAPGLSLPVEPYLRLAADVGVTPRSLQRDRRDLYSAQWGLNIQRELPMGFVTQIGYTGNSGVKLFARQYINNVDPITKVRPLPTFGRMDEKRQDGKSTFNALQLSLHRRVGRGLNWGTEYMWSHTINDGNIGGARASSRRSPSAAPATAATARRTSATPSRATGSTSFPSVPARSISPPARRRRSWADGRRAASGPRARRMLTVGISRSAAAVPDGNTSGQRPSIVPGVSIYPAGGPTLAQWLNPAAFFIPANGTWGNAGRSIATGPGLVQVDFSLQKNTRIAEGKALVFRIETFNLFNRTQAGNPGTTLTSPASFGW